MFDIVCCIYCNIVKSILSNTNRNMATSVNNKECTLQYSPFIKCCNALHTVYDGKGLCRYHFYMIKENEVCPICLTTMNDNNVKVMLSCRHYFHKDCLSKCCDSRCPMCRKQMTAREGRRIFLPTVWTPMIENVYMLPHPSVVLTIDTIQKVIRVCEQGEWFTEQINDFCDYFVKACDVASDVHNETRLSRNIQEHHNVLDALFSSMVDIMYDVRDEFR
jgi:hypothetical protein